MPGHEVARPLVDEQGLLESKLVDTADKALVLGVLRASPRGQSSSRIPLAFVEVEPLVVPKRNLSGRTSELIDTRVLQVVYAIDSGFRSPGIGQQFDVYIESQGDTP